MNVVWLSLRNMRDFALTFIVTLLAFLLLVMAVFGALMGEGCGWIIERLPKQRLGFYFRETLEKLNDMWDI